MGEISNNYFIMTLDIQADPGTLPHLGWKQLSEIVGKSSMLNLSRFLEQTLVSILHFCVAL